MYEIAGLLVTHVVIYLVGYIQGRRGTPLL